MTEDGIQEVADRFSEVLVHVPPTDAKAMADLCDWFRSLKSSHLSNEQQRKAGIIEAAARVLETMMKEKVDHDVEVFNRIRNEGTYRVCRKTTGNNKSRIKRMLRQELERMNQLSDSTMSIKDKNITLDN